MQAIVESNGILFDGEKPWKRESEEIGYTGEVISEIKSDINGLKIEVRDIKSKMSSLGCGDD